MCASGSLVVQEVMKRVLKLWEKMSESPQQYWLDVQGREEWSSEFCTVSSNGIKPDTEPRSWDICPSSPIELRILCPWISKEKEKKNHGKQTHELEETITVPFCTVGGKRE